jgi:hypothetical protein
MAAQTQLSAQAQVSAQAQLSQMQQAALAQALAQQATLIQYEAPPQSTASLGSASMQAVVAPATDASLTEAGLETRLKSLEQYIAAHADKGDLTPEEMAAAIRWERAIVTRLQDMKAQSGR